MNQCAISTLFYLNQPFVLERFEERKYCVSAPVPAFGKVTDFGKKRNACPSVSVQIYLLFLLANDILKRLITGCLVRQ